MMVYKLGHALCARPQHAVYYISSEKCVLVCIEVTFNTVKKKLFDVQIESQQMTLGFFPL